ncbi:MAG: AraC family transcriptional regulator [Myxococcota bacterium]
MRHRRGVSNDPFSDVLRLTEPTSVVSGGFVARGAWALRFPPPGKLKFSALAKGACWLQVDDQEGPRRVEQGDVFLLTGRHGFVVGSHPALPAEDAYRVLRARTGPFAEVGAADDGEAECVVLAGQVSLHPSSGALLMDVLPPILHVRATSPQAAPLRWIVEQLFAERGSSLPGASIAAAQLAQLMFIQVLRAHLADADAPPVGWLRAIGDERLGPALRLMHGEPSRAWRLDELARAAGMSRTSFAAHFKAVAGVAPLGYLTEWRMRLAQRALREEDTAVFQLAESLGYASESAFSNAFKRVIGSAPRHARPAARRPAVDDA